MISPTIRINLTSGAYSITIIKVMEVPQFVLNSNSPESEVLPLALQQDKSPVYCLITL